MPGSLCPKCGSLCILSVTNPAEWYKKLYPGQKPGEIVSGLCFDCWKAEQKAMTRDHQHNPDPNTNAARIVAESTAGQAGSAADLEAAWAEWSSHLQKVDERAMTLLRAAFEAGWDAGQSHSAGSK